ncbi:MAG: NADH-quinone oxidoreductase subunit NuoH [Spirochaetia bacterium]|nr:NADH-quinone oxidoreductase subunit NuoH [Spirochaetia bacterium]
MEWYESEIIWVLIKILLLFFVIITGAGYYTLMERKGAGYFQLRYGPNRAGIFGIFQPLADGIKFLLKQETLPKNVDIYLFLAAPAISVITAVLLWSSIPFTPLIKLPVEVLGKSEVNLQVLNPNSGLLFLFAISSLSVYGILLAGWSSNNKYSLLGAVRSTAQMISYELSLSLSIIGVILMTGHLDIYRIVEAQSKYGWFLLTIPGFLSFFIFIVSVFAETNRLPFDLAEAESELIVGYHTEYGAFKFALFMVAEYINLITISFLTALLFFGGWNVPFFLREMLEGLWWGPLVGVLFFVVKGLFFAFLFIWVRWSLPRFRYDQLMNIGWKYLLPLAIFQIFLSGIYLYIK